MTPKSQPAGPAAAVNETNSAVGLKEYLDGLGAVLRAQPDAWVRCELLILKPFSGFVRMEFVEHDARGKQQASTSGGCWPDRFEQIQRAFTVNGLTLEPGCKVMVKLRANLQATYGFKVDVLDIDPVYTLGDLKVRLDAIRKRLSEAGLWDCNRSLARPRDFVRVAVISPAGAAGLGDFRSTAEALAAKGLVAFTYFEAPFQTADAPLRITEALKSLYPDCKAGRYCAVAIIRGGGAAGDLTWLADYELVRAVCLTPVPVITGIGHERDTTLLDEVACIRCGTPSKAVEHVRASVINAALEADAAIQGLRAHAGTDLAVVEAGIAKDLVRISTVATNALRSAEEVVRTSSEAIRLAPSGAVDIGTRALISVCRGIAASVAAMLKAADFGVSSADRIVAASPAEAAESALEALNRVRNKLGITVASALRTTELAVSSAVGSVPAYCQAVLQQAQASVHATARAISSDAHAGLLAVPMRAAQTSIMNQARLMVAGLAEQVGRIRATAEAMDPKTVISAGYAILRGMDGLPLTRVAAVTSASVMLAELRDGTAKLKPFRKEVKR